MENKTYLIEEAANYIGVSRRNFERMNVSSREEFREAKDGKKRKVRVYDETELERIKSERETPTHSGSLVTTTNDNLPAQVGRSSNLDFLEGINQLAQMMHPARKSILTELSGKIFISIDDLAQFSGIAKSQLEKAIKEAEEKGILHHYTGERGKSVYRCDELDLLIENLPPTPKQLPPKKSNL